jgi:hypothetical protein
MKKEIITKIKRFVNGAAEVVAVLIYGAVAIVIGLAGIIKRNKLTTIAIVTFTILFGWMVSEVIIRGYAWNQEVNNRIEIEISRSGLRFNRTQPRYTPSKYSKYPNGKILWKCSS